MRKKKRLPSYCARLARLVLRGLVMPLPDRFRSAPHGLSDRRRGRFFGRSFRVLRGSSWHQRRPRSLHDLSSALTRTTGARRFIEVELSQYQRRSRISTPAAIASTASTVLTVVETRTFSNGKSPVRINQTASKIIPRFLPTRVLVIANLFPPL
jgi:hypothetical protein